MKDIVINVRFVFPPNMRKYMEQHFGAKQGTNEDIRNAITMLVETWEQDLAFEYFDAKKKENK